MAAFALTPEIALPDKLKLFPQIRFMGSKARLLPWIHEVLAGLEFESAVDAFSGSGAVGYLLKSMGKRVVSNDRLAFSAVIAEALVENGSSRLLETDVEHLLRPNPQQRHFIEETFAGIFFQPADLRFLDLVWSNLSQLDNQAKRAIALAALIRSCVKRQPRGVFTVAGDPDHYKDGRRDLRLSLQEHFIEHVETYNQAVFDNGRANVARHGDVFTLDAAGIDLVYMDPPYVPRSDDNCYIKRYHFLEGLATYWEGLEILETSRVKKVRKPFTPFSYRRKAVDAFDRLFHHFHESTLVLSYSSNGFPDLPILVDLMKRYKRQVEVHERSHRYHFGTHSGVERNRVTEYLIVGR
jgi:DNA adenine methylase/adenine-specific DNA-methyltransferase